MTTTCHPSAEISSPRFETAALPALLARSWTHRASWAPSQTIEISLAPISAPQAKAKRTAEPLFFNPEVLHLPNDFAGHPVLAPLLQRWLKNLQPVPAQTRSFRDRWALVGQETPATLRCLSRQIAQVLDIAPIAVHLGPREPFLYAEVGQVEKSQVMICHPELETRPRAEQRFLLMRATFAHFQKHNAVMALSQNWSWETRDQLLSLFFSWNQRNARPILNEDWFPQPRTEQSKSLARLSQALNQLYQKYQAPALYDLRELLVRTNPFRKELELEANLFATMACGMEMAQIMLPLLYGEEFAATQLQLLSTRVEQIQAESNY